MVPRPATIIPPVNIIVLSVRNVMFLETAQLLTMVLLVPELLENVALEFVTRMELLPILIITPVADPDPPV